MVAKARDVLSEEQVVQVMRQALRAAGDDGLTEAELRQVLDWARQAAMDRALFELVLEGEIAVTVRGGEIWTELVVVDHGAAGGQS